MVCVALGHCNILVAKQFLDFVQIDTVLNKPCGECVTKIMEVEGSRYSLS